MADKKLTSVSQVGLDDTTYIFAETTDGVHKVSSDEFADSAVIDTISTAIDTISTTIGTTDISNIGNGTLTDAINELDFTTRGISFHVFNINTPVSIPVSTYAMLLVIGFFQGIGGKLLGIQVQGTTLTVRDLMSGSAYSSTYLPITLNNGVVKIESNQSSFSKMTVIKSWIDMY